MSITLSPDGAARFQFSSRALMSVKYDGIQGRWNGRTLTTREGNPISAPVWFIRQLPRRPLVGELWMGNGGFSECQSVILRAVPDDRWHGVKFMVFEGEAEGANVETVRQIPVRNSDQVRRFSADIIRDGGEGAFIRDGAEIVKVKSFEDREAVVLRHREGRGRFGGQAGAFTVQDGAFLLHIGSGIPDSLRRTPPKVGTVISYGFQGRTANGKPRFPVFLRIREAA